MFLLPGSTIGIVGGGQLGRMLAFECKRMNYKTAVIDKDPNCPTAQIADKFFPLEKVDDFCKEVDVATAEFEHFDDKTIEYIAKNTKLLPSLNILKIKQSKITEKKFLSENKLPTPKFWCGTKEQIPNLLKNHKLVVKLAKGGYDGKGLFTIKNIADYKKYKSLLEGELLIEALVPFEKEISVICARNISSQITLFPPVENIHDKGILFYNIAPAKISKNTSEKANKIAIALAKKLNLVGIVAVEMFVLKNGDVLINEFAPRPHNSGHHSIDSCTINQFEMVLRCITNLPLKQPKLVSNAVMLNILGKNLNEIDLNKLLKIDGLKFYFYGKNKATGRRKMGHVNILGDNYNELNNKLMLAKKIIYGS